MARKETPASQQRNVEIVGGYTSQIIALLAVNYAATVVELTILQPFVEVESAETQKRHKRHGGDRVGWYLGGCLLISTYLLYYAGKLA